MFIVMLVNILLQDGRTNYIEGVLRKSTLENISDRCYILSPFRYTVSHCPLPYHRPCLLRLINNSPRPCGQRNTKLQPLCYFIHSIKKT